MTEQQIETLRQAQKLAAELSTMLAKLADSVLENDDTPTWDRDNYWIFAGIHGHMADVNRDIDSLADLAPDYVKA